MSLKDLKNSDILVGMFVRNIEHAGFLNESLFSIAMQNSPVNLLILHSDLSDADVEKLHAIAKNPTVQMRTKNKIKVKNEDGTETEKEEIVTESATNVLNYVVEKVEASNFSDVFNKVFQAAVEHGYKYASITEPEDVYSLRWFELVETWHDENPEISMFFPLIKHMNFGAFHGFMNESCWADGMAEEVGKYDNNLLLKFNFAAHPLGATCVIDNMLKGSAAYETKADGLLYPMKHSIKLFNYYEFFLRSAYNDNKMMNIPRIGYEMRVVELQSYDQRSSKIPHTLLSLPADKGGLSAEEAQFWGKYATDAYFMEEDNSEIKYEPAN